MLKVLLFSLLIFSFSVNAQIYRWVDESGKVHYSDKKPEGAKQEEVHLKKHDSQWQQYVIEVNDVDNILTAEEKKRIEDDVNDVYRFFDEVLYFDIYKTVPVKIRLYETQNSYIRHLKSKGSTNIFNSRGVYYPASNEIILYLNPEERWRTFWTIKHETSHAIVDTLTPFVPRWLNEGIAENMEALGVSEKSFFLHPHHENFNSINKAYKNGTRFDIAEFLSLPSKDYDRHATSAGRFRQSFVGELVRMLLSSKSGKVFLNRLIHSYERGDRTFSTYLVDKHYLGGMIVMQNNWTRWVNRPGSTKLEL